MPSLPFPWRAEDLSTDRYWFKSSSDRWDFIVKQRTDSGGWTDTDSDPGAPVQNDDHLCFGVPVYAMADGEVVSAWCRAPQNERPGVRDSNNVSKGGTGISLSGNHVAVLGDDGDVILYAHLRTNTVPPELCPMPQAEFMPDARVRVTVEGIAKPDFPRDSAWVSAAGRPRVSRGQRLGLTGNSGNSFNPHLHIQRWNGAGDAAPFTFVRGWSNDKALTKWRPFTGQGVAPEDTDVVILASPLLRRGDTTAGGFGEIAMHFVRSRRLITALRDEHGDLKLISWDLTPPEQIARRHDVTAGRASEIAIAEPRSDILVTALRDGDGNLRVISWRVESNGTFTRCADDVAGPASKISIVTQQEGVVVVAVRAASGKLKLIAWRVASSDGGLTRRGDADDEPIADVRLMPTSAFQGVVTAAKTSSGGLKLTAWQVAESGRSITRRGVATAESIRALSVVSRGDNRQFLLTALRDSAGAFRLIAWRVSDGGRTIDRLSTAVAGEITEVGIAGTMASSRSAVVACRDSSGNLRLMTWELSSDGTRLARLGGALAGAASQIAISATSDSGRTFFVTACATASGHDLKLINWEGNL